MITKFFNSFKIIQKAPFSNRFFNKNFELKRLSFLLIMASLPCGRISFKHSVSDKQLRFLRNDLTNRTAILLPTIHSSNVTEVILVPHIHYCQLYSYSSGNTWVFNNIFCWSFSDLGIVYENLAVVIFGFIPNKVPLQPSATILMFNLFFLIATRCPYNDWAKGTRSIYQTDDFKINLHLIRQLSIFNL